MSTPNQTPQKPSEKQVQTRYPQSNIAACMLPWTKDFKLAVSVFEAHVQSAIDDGYKNIYLMGTAGEGYALNDAMFQQVVEIFASKTVGKGLAPQVGTINLSMRQIINRFQFCYDQGIRMLQISLPSWGPLDESEMMLFFKTVCGEFPDCQFLHYNLPRAKHIITGTQYRRIIDQVPNLVATKNSSTDYARTADLMTHVPDLQHFFLEGNFAMGCTMGECSLLCSYDAIFPKTTWKFYEAGLRKDLPELFRITKLLYDFDKTIFAHCNRQMIDGSYDKTYIWLRYPEFSYRLQPPYIGLSEEEASTCRHIFESQFRHID